jgi:heme A synthase
MTVKQRRLVYELIAIGVAGILGAFVVPMMLSERNSVSVVAAGLLLIGWVVWLCYYLFRVNEGGK